MRTYTLSFGQITLQPGAPELTPAVLQWIEEQASIRIPAAIKTIIEEALMAATMGPPDALPIVLDPEERAALEALHGAPVRAIDVPGITLTPEQAR